MYFLASILIIDDEPTQRNLLAQVLRLEGHLIRESGTVKAGLEVLGNEEPDLVLLDVRLPDGNGVEVCRRIKANYPGVEIVMLTAHGNIRDGIEAMRNGAFDYLTKGDDNGRIIPTIAQALEKRKLNRERTPETSSAGFDAILGSSSQILAAKELAARVAPTEATVLLLGKTGTGKEVFARAIHEASARAKEPFVAINCGAFGRELLESELFGYKAGAFTGAQKDKKGLVEAAVGGTLFLDEIGEMSLELQTKLLRLLEAGTYIRLGDTKEVRADVRFVAATNRDLRLEASQGRFRLDLFYRLSVFEITLPELRDRGGDIEQLARHFLEQAANRMGKKLTGMEAQALQALTHYAWPGNSRELRNMMERAAILAPAGFFTLTTDLLAVHQLTQEVASSAGKPLRLDEVEWQHIQRVLDQTSGNKAEAARLLGIGLTTLYRKLDEHGMKA